MEPLLFRVDEAGGRVVVHGNHRLMAARALGWEEVAAFDVSDLGEEQIEALILGMNRAGQVGGYDVGALRDRLEAMSERARGGGGVSGS